MKMKYLNTKILLLGIIVISMFSCDDYLDINDDPNKAVDIDPGYLFGYATMSYSGNRLSGDTYMPIALANQTISSGGSFGWGYGADRYNISPYSTGNTWRMIFSTAGNNLKQAISRAEMNTPVNNNAAAQAKILLASVVLDGTMIYGDIPFSEAWDPAISHPKFDTQEEVLNGLISLLDEALDQIDESSLLKIADNDIFFNGDLTKWKRFANSLKFKIAMIMVDKDPSKATLIGDLLSGGEMISSVNDNVLVPYYNESNQENPKFKLLKQHNSGINNWFFANTSVFDLMSTLNDPRIPVYFDEGEDAAEGVYTPVLSATEADKYSSVISLYLYRADAPDVIFSYQEQLLLEAEAYARGLGVAQDLNRANDLFASGVEASMAFYEVPTADISNFLNNDLPNLTSVSQVEAVKQIHIQQYIDLMDRSIEAWVQFRRSGPEGSEVPNLQVPNGAQLGGLFRRYIYPDDELSSNKNAPASQSKFYEKQWFDN